MACATDVPLPGTLEFDAGVKPNSLR